MNAKGKVLFPGYKGERVFKSFRWHKTFIWWPRRIAFMDESPRIVFLRTVYRRMIVKNFYPDRVRNSLGYARDFLNRYHVMDTDDQDKLSALKVHMMNANVLVHAPGMTVHSDINVLSGHGDEATFEWVYATFDDLAMYIL